MNSEYLAPPQSRGLFATHYHHLSSQHSDDPRVSIMHMACAVPSGGSREGDEDKAETEQGSEEVQEVTFLYKLAPGELTHPHILPYIHS